MLARIGQNRAAELGPSTFDWWKDWRGECVAIVASGPSTRKEDVEALRGRIHVAVIKENVNLCPWADVVYGCDAAWWKHRRGLPEYGGLKLSWDAAACSKFNLHRVEIKAKSLDSFTFEKPGVIGSGGNSAFQLMNIVLQFGVTGVLCIGLDLHGRSGAHWYGRNNWPGANNPSDSNFHRWRKAFGAAASDLATMGVDVVNASSISALKCFRRASVEQALRGWGL